MISKELIKGTLKTIILKLLNEQGQMVLTEGALYPMLHKLEAEGFVKTKQVSIGKRLRKYYRLTPKGKKATVNKLAEFQAFINTMQLILKPSSS